MKLSDLWEPQWWTVNTNRGGSLSSKRKLETVLHNFRGFEVVDVKILVKNDEGAYVDIAMSSPGEYFEAKAPQV